MGSMANSDVRETVKLLPSTRRGSSISASRVRKGVSEGMATSVRPNQVAHQRVRDFNLLESRLRWPSTNLRRFVTFRTHPSQELSVEQPCGLVVRLSPRDTIVED